MIGKSEASWLGSKLAKLITSAMFLQIRESNRRDFLTYIRIGFEISEKPTGSALVYTISLYTGRIL